MQSETNIMIYAIIIQCMFFYLFFLKVHVP